MRRQPGGRPRASVYVCVVGRRNKFEKVDCRGWGGKLQVVDGQLRSMHIHRWEYTNCKRAIRWQTVGEGRKEGKRTIRGILFSMVSNNDSGQAAKKGGIPEGSVPFSKNVCPGTRQEDLKLSAK